MKQNNATFIVLSWLAIASLLANKVRLALLHERGDAFLIVPALVDLGTITYQPAPISDWVLHPQGKEVDRHILSKLIGMGRKFL
ncbi:MAG TPA: hypothetical protein V6D48_20115 [Oculatellaceae cyanobacterium]